MARTPTYANMASTPPPGANSQNQEITGKPHQIDLYLDDVFLTRCPKFASDDAKKNNDVVTLFTLSSTKNGFTLTGTKNKIT